MIINKKEIEIKLISDKYRWFLWTVLKYFTKEIKFF